MRELWITHGAALAQEFCCSCPQSDICRRTAIRLTFCAASPTRYQPGRSPRHSHHPTLFARQAQHDTDPGRSPRHSHHPTRRSHEPCRGPYAFFTSLLPREVTLGSIRSLARGGSSSITTSTQPRGRNPNGRGMHISSEVSP
jgi:hypothetical protein